MNQGHINTRDLMSQAKFFESYSRFNDEEGRYETWDEAVSRVMDTHRTYYKSKDKYSDKLNSYIQEAEALYKEQKILGSQRALQFGGEQLLSNHMRLYNCTSSYADRAEFFGEIFWILLCGAGAGFSVQTHHIAKLPGIATRNKQAKIHVVEDSIEGWAEALDVLMSSYFVGGGKHPEFEGRRVYFDLSQIREKGAFISGGFKAPGPVPLRNALDKIEHLLQGLVLSGISSLRAIHVYDIVMHAADAVLAGGVRRSATICLFSKEDDEMMKAKTGNWFIDNPQRGRSNNSVVLKRDEVSEEEFSEIMKSVKEFGEPGFVFVSSYEHCFNPCVTGDTILNVKNSSNGKKYTMKIKDYVDIFKQDPNNAPLVLSQDIETNEVKYSKVNGAELTRKNADIIQIELDDGKVLKCTPDHKIYTSNRGYVEAKDLNEDDDVVVL